MVTSPRKVKNKVKKILPFSEGPFFILGQLYDLVYHIQRGPKTKVKVVHHAQLKPYHSRDPLDNMWALEQAQSWMPLEVSPPALDTDFEDHDLGLTGLFVNPGVGDTYNNVLQGDLQGSGGGPTNMSQQGTDSAGVYLQLKRAREIGSRENWGIAEERFNAIKR